MTARPSVFPPPVGTVHGEQPGGKARARDRMTEDVRAQAVDMEGFAALARSAIYVNNLVCSAAISR